MFDPRDEIKAKLNAYQPTGQQHKGIVFHTDRNDEWQVKVYLWEDKESEFEEGGKLGFENPNMILLSTVSSISRNEDIGGEHRSRTALIDAHIFCVKDERWKVEDAVQEISDNLEAAIVANQKSVTNCIFVECTNARDLDALKQTLGKRRIVGIRAWGEYT
jgi:murein tripeptide amidase MpaA